MGILAGTSGWQYRDWRGAFYPVDVPQRRWLEFYAGRYDTVENNGTFYRLAGRDTFEAWRERLPAGFVMAVKASRYLTHIRRLKDPAEPVRRLMAAATGLGERLGPVLLQLPPTMTAAPDLLDGCLAQFPSGIRIAVEPRHSSWWTERTRQVLTDRGAALCWVDRRGEPQAPLWRTTDWGYLRFHEGDGSPWPRYRRETLATWASRVAATWPHASTVYAFFNNDQLGAAPMDAAVFSAIADAAAPLNPVSRLPARCSNHAGRFSERTGPTGGGWAGSRIRRPVPGRRRRRSR